MRLKRSSCVAAAMCVVALAVRAKTIDVDAGDSIADAVAAAEAGGFAVPDQAPIGCYANPKNGLTLWVR